MAVLATCHNRRDKTLLSLDKLYKQTVPPGTMLQVYLVDDGSSDGTADAVRATYPQTTLLQGEGDLFWNGGMRLAFSEALNVGYDYYLWLNDDTLLKPDALANLLDTHRGLAKRGDADSIVVGSTRDMESGILTYGGVVRTNRFRPLRLEMVEPAQRRPIPCDTMNGNCVLIPRGVAEKVGNLSDAFTHGMGDNDYGFRAREMGCSVWVAPGFVGYCSKNSLRGTWADTSVSLRERLRKVRQPKGLPPGDWKVFAQRHAGPFWPAYWAYPYARLVGSSIQHELKSTFASYRQSTLRKADFALGEEVRAKGKRPRVAIIQKSVSHYRHRFFDLLREELDEAGVELILIYGQPGAGDAAKKDTVEIPWGYKVKNVHFRIGSREMYWQPCLRLLSDADLVIVEQANKLLLNYVLFTWQLLGVRKLAFWGHGKNFQAEASNRISELIKRFVSRRVHWWFAYNELSADVVRNIRFPKNRITVVQNAIDTRRLTQIRHRVDEMDVENVKQDLGLEGENTCIYVGGMYAEKRLDFLLQACALVRKDIPNFEIVFLGSGPDKAIVEEAASEHDWVRYVGPKFQEEKVPYFMLSKLVLLPGAVGLSVLDSFALEVPLVTTAVPSHGPEIDYLEDGVNGVVVRETDNPAMYASAVARLLKDGNLRGKLVSGCRSSKDKYTVEEMAERFASGVRTALGQRL